MSLKIIDPDNGPGTDYISVGNFDAAYAKNLVTATEVVTGECRCTAGGADTNGFDMSQSWTTSSTYYIRIWTDPTGSYRHAGTWSTSKYRFEATDQVGMIHWQWASPTNISIEGIQFKMYDIANSVCIDFAGGPTAGNVFFNNCIFKGVSLASTSNSYAIYIGSNVGASVVVRVMSSLFYDLYYNYSGIAVGGFGGDVRVYNCTIKNVNYAFRDAGANMTLKNNLVQTTHQDFCLGTPDTADYNASETGDTVPGTHTSTGTATFVDATNKDFHLSASDTLAKSNGTDLSAVMTLIDGTVCKDIDNETISTWSLGCDCFAAAGGGGSPQIFGRLLTLMGVG